MAEKVLLIEDEENIRGFTKLNVAMAGFDVIEAETGEEGIEMALAENPDVVILDIMLPGIDGYEVCRILREKMPRVGIIMLTAKSQEVDKILGLEQGTDDYMIKPFNPEELVLRIKSLVRRMEMSEKKQEREQVVKDGPFKLDTYSKLFYKNEKEVDLTPTEFSIVEMFILNPGKAFSRNEILDLTWGKDYSGDTKIVDVNIRRIRAKIEDNPGRPSFLETVWGVGYRWKSRAS
jgi:two-component system alkaline phosphatase synthesis response regulator PhoP